MCEHHGQHGRAGCCGESDWRRGRECWPGMRFDRHFPTREERIARMEEYLRDLQAEAKAVEERLAEMRGAG